MKSILFLTSTSLANNPRIVKEVKTCVSLGHKVTVISFAYQNWSKPLNEQIVTELDQRVCYITLPGDRANKIKWVKSTFFNLLARNFVKLKPDNIYFSSISLSKQSWLLLSELRHHHRVYDLVIAHNPGAFVPALLYSGKTGAELGIDMEDYHPGESNDPVVAERLEGIIKKVSAKAKAITASSPLILAQSEKLFTSSRSKRMVVRNVFSVEQQPTFKQLGNNLLKLIWFSQTVGLNRGIQDAIQAMCCIKDFPIHLTIVGNCNKENKKILTELLSVKKHTLAFLPPISESKLIEECSFHHIGLALEPGFSLNNSLALSNKIFTYLLAGNAIIASETQAQKMFFEEHPGIGRTYPIGKIEQLANHFIQYKELPDQLMAARENAYQLARTQLNWEAESQRFVELYGLS